MKVDEETIERWSKPPENARPPGPCSNPMCDSPNCIGPAVDVYELDNEQYQGPLVIVSYTTADNHGGVQINGECFVWGSTKVPNPDGFSSALDAIRKRFSNGAVECITDHLGRRRLRHGSAADQAVRH